MTAARPALLVALRTWLLPVALGAGAFALHYALHVPPGPLPPPSPAEIEAEKKAAEKEKRDEEKKQRDEDRKAGKARPDDKPTRTGPRDLPYEPFTRPRPEFILAQLREYYGPRAFKTEPTFDAWQTAHKSLLGQLVSAARQVVLPDGPVITVVSSECHTIRCRLTLGGPEAAPLQQVSDLLEGLELDGRSLWFAYKTGKVVEEPSKREGSPGRHKLEITVSFMRDLPPIDRIQTEGKPLPRPGGAPSREGPGDPAMPDSTRPGRKPPRPAPDNAAGDVPDSTRPGRATSVPTPGPGPTPGPVPTPK